MSLHVSTAELPNLSAVARVPTYSRAELRGGIVHFGVGNFHRAHMAVYLDDLLSLGEARDWAIVGAGVRDADARMRGKLAGQDFMSTIVEQDPKRTDVRITGSMIDFLDPNVPEEIVSRLADPAIRIVSLTITEGGYYIDPATGRFNAKNPAVRRDLADMEHPRTIFGMLVAALRLRRAAGNRPFTVMSCDNITGNGEITHNTLHGFAALADPELARWIEREVSCPNTMVDRIAPATGERERDRLRSQFGIEDVAPIFCEGFRQWIVEDRFSAGRPPLEKVGVTLVENVAPFELMKIRILNGGHAALSYPGALLDMEFVHDAMHDPLLARYFGTLQRTEIIPLVPPVPGTDLDAYVTQVMARFGNAKMGDTNRRVCFDGSNRQPQYVLPTALAAAQGGTALTGLAMVSAFWCRYCAGVTESGREIAPNDPQWDRLREKALEARTNPDVFLGMTEIFGELRTHPAYAEAFGAALKSIWERGARETIRCYLDGSAA